MKSPLYASPWFYEMLIKARHGQAMKERMAIIAGLLDGKNIVELGCATGYNSEFLKGSYRGFDMNRSFIDYGKKKMRNVEMGNVFDVPLNEYDAILIVDVLHHVPAHKGLMKKTLSTGKEVVVCEPFDRNFNSRLAEWAFTKINKWVDSDGINPPVDWYKKDELKQYFTSFGKCGLYEVGEDIIAHYKNGR